MVQVRGQPDAGNYELLHFPMGQKSWSLHTSPEKELHKKTGLMDFGGMEVRVLVQGAEDLAARRNDESLVMYGKTSPCWKATRKKDQNGKSRKSTLKRTC